jgi:hypothetical protein
VANTHGNVSDGGNTSEAAHSFITRIDLDLSEVRVKKQIANCATFLHISINTVHFIDPVVHKHVLSMIGTVALHSYITSRCLVILEEGLANVSSKSLRGISLSQALALSPELRYAILHWGTHASFCQYSSPSLVHKIFSVFALHHKDNIIQKWWAFYLTLHFGCKQAEFEKKEQLATTVTHMMARFGLHIFMDAAIDSPYWSKLESQLECEDCFTARPLQLATLYKHQAVVELIVASGIIPRKDDMS